MSVHLLLLTSLFLTLSGPQHNDRATYDLRKVGAAIRTLKVDGTISATGGPMAVSGLPFAAVIAAPDSMRVTMSGPLGMTAGRLYARPDHFVFVDYMQRRVLDGRPDAPDLVRTMPFPITVSDLSALIRGAVPGDVQRFAEVSVRRDGSVLFGASTSDGMEFALVDTSANMLRQYQRKRSDGTLLLNVTFDDVRTVNDVSVAHAVDVLVDDRRQAMSFRLTTVLVNTAVAERLTPDIPPSFTRTTYR